MADEQHAGSRIKTHHVVVGICVAILVVFALLNLDDVRIHLVFKTVHAPLVLVIVVCALLGFVVGWFVGHRRNDD